MKDSDIIRDPPVPLTIPGIWAAAGSKGFMSLRFRFILITSFMLLFLLATLAIVLGTLQTRTIRDKIEKQGIAISKNLAAVSVDHLLTYNYVAMEKLANQAANNPDIVYVVIHDKEGKIAGYSGRPDLLNRFLTDSVSLAAINLQEPKISVHDPESGDIPVMDISVPVFLPGSTDRWGTVRVRLSLELMYLQIRQTQWSILILGVVGLSIGILISNWAAQRVTKPLDTLVTATVEAAQGNLDQKIAIHTRDEVEILASNFSHMIREILAQRQQLEQHLSEIRQLQQYAEEILSTMHDGLLAVDMEGRVTAINPAARSILDLPPDDGVIGSPAVSLFEKGTPLDDYIRHSLDYPSDRNQQELHLEYGSRKRILLAGRGALETDTNTPRQIIFTLNDITAMKQLEAEIRQNQRLADLGTLAAGMAHEIRNPLSAIKTYVSLLPRKIGKPDFLEKFQRTVPREINRLNTLIEELLELSRPPRYTFKPTDIGQLLRQSVELMEADFRTRGVECRCEIAADLPQITADADQMKKVFINLMQNGAQAMPDGGVITIRTSFDNSSGITMKFRDQGHGFSADTAENIFNPFFTTKAKGTGLGLAITHKIISEHGGQIEADSPKNGGACFTIHLPGMQQ